MPKHRRKRFKKDLEKQNEAKNEDANTELNDENDKDQEETKGEATDQFDDGYKDILEEPVEFSEYFREYKSLDDVPPERLNRFIESNFPPHGTEEEIEEKYHLSRCIRVFANDQDTSGFFIALIKRKSKFTNQTKPEENKLEAYQDSVIPVQSPLTNMIRCDPKDPDIEYIKTYYGLTDDFPLDQIFTFSENMNKLLLVNRGLSDFFYADKNKQINLIAAGAESFIRNSSKNYSGVDCIFRISQNGVRHIYPFMKKRIFYIDIEMFKFLLNVKRINVEELEESDFKLNMKKLSCGCFVVVTKVGEDKEEALVLHRHVKHINTMISELNLHKIKLCLNDF